MGFIRHGQRSTKYLKDFTGELIALRFVGEVPGVVSELPDGTKSTTDVVRANIVSFDPAGSNPQRWGELLVHPRILATTLRESPNDWHLGVLTQETQADGERTVYILSAPESERAYDRMEAAL